MKLYSKGNNYTLYNGNMQNLLDVIQPNSIDSIITDPPYELNFMGKSWDNSGIAFQKETWEKCYTALKSGGYLLAFGGSRTFHRIACAIEDAGFEIRDTIMWLYGTGFPKSMDIEKAINKREGVDFEKIKASGVGFMNTNDDGYHNTEHQLIQIGESSENGKRWNGWGTALKPAYEPIIIARKPCEGSCIDNVLKYGVGGINIGECRIGTALIGGGTVPNIKGGNYNNAKGAERLECEDHIGRFPANVILTYDETDQEEVIGGMPYTTSSGGVTSVPDFKDAGKKNSYNKIGFNDGGTAERTTYNRVAPIDEGSAARYFYCAKASKRDRDEGLEDFKTQKTGDLQGGRKEGSAGSIMKNADGGTRVNPYAGTGAPKKNTHPTVKPTSLMQYLVRLVTPKGGTILDPFNGSGSTGKAVMFENKDRQADYKYIGIELTEEYLPISKARICYAAGESKEAECEEQSTDGQVSIFDIIS